MIEQLKKIVRDNAQEAIFKNSEVPDNKNEQAVDAASTSIMEVIKEKITSGKIKDIIGGNTEADTAVLKNDVMDNFSKKLEGLGIGGGTAQSIASSVIPIVISQLLNKKGGSSVDLQEMISSLSGGKFDLSSLGGILGGDKNDDKEGGIMGKVKDLF